MMNSSAKGNNNKNNSAPCIINCNNHHHHNNHTPTVPTGYPAQLPPPVVTVVVNKLFTRPAVVNQNQHALVCGTTTNTNPTLPISNTKHAFGLSHRPITEYPYCYNGPHHLCIIMVIVPSRMIRMNPVNNNATVTATLPPSGTSGIEGGGVGYEILPSPTAPTATAVPIPVTQIVQNVLRKTEIGSTSMIHYYYDISSSASSIHGKAGTVLTPNHPPTKLRSGKRIPEEEAYAVFLVQLFFQGILLDCMDGTTLRAYLTPKLRCTPMRISKKFAGKEIGKVLYQQSTRKKMDATTNAQLHSLERQFQVATTRFPPGTFAVTIDRPPASTTATPTMAILPTTTTTTTTTTGTTVDHKNGPSIRTVPSQQIPVPQSIPSNRSLDGMTSGPNVSYSAVAALTLTHGGFGRPVVNTETGGQPFPFTLNVLTPALAQSSALGVTPSATTNPPTVLAHGPTTMAGQDSTVGQTQSPSTKPPANISYNGDNNHGPPNNDYCVASAERMCKQTNVYPIHCPSTTTSTEMEEVNAVESASKYHDNREAFNDADAAKDQFLFSRPTSPSLDDFYHFLTKEDELTSTGATIPQDDSTQHQSSPKRFLTMLDSTTNHAMMMMMMMGGVRNDEEELDYDSLLATPKRSLSAKDTTSDGTTKDDLISDSMLWTSKKQRRLLLSEVFPA